MKFFILFFSLLSLNAFSATAELIAECKGKTLSGNHQIQLNVYLDAKYFCVQDPEQQPIEFPGSVELNGTTLEAKVLYLRGVYMVAGVEEEQFAMTLQSFETGDATSFSKLGFALLQCKLANLPDCQK